MKITLLNGKELTCRVKNQKYEKDSWPKLDTTGEYLSFGPSKHKKKTTSPEWKFFADHAYYFLGRANEIFEDSMMFLAPVPVNNHLAYSGTSGFRHATLGVYLEWWQNHNDSALTFMIAGSPLTGVNSCLCVDAQANVKEVAYSCFHEVFSSFMDVNRRYSKAAQLCEAYTLEKVFDILEARRKRRKLFFLNSPT